MQVPITSGQTPEMAHVSRSPITNENGLNDLHESEELPAYSREPTEDGYAYEQQAEIVEKKGLHVNINETHPAERTVPPTTHEPGYASESTLRRGLQVPTKSRYITSGFAYPDILAQCDVNMEQWFNFTQEITNEAKMTPGQWTTTVGKGFGTFVVGGIFFGWLGLIPAAVVGHKVRQHNEAKNLALARSKNVLQEILNRWNEAVFRPKGLIIRIDLPGEAMDMDSMDILSSKGCNKQSNCQSTSRCGKSDLRAMKREVRTRCQAAKKGRIVILPLGPQVSSLVAATPTRGLSPVDHSAPSPAYVRSPVVEQREVVDSYPDEKRGQVGPM